MKFASVNGTAMQCGYASIYNHEFVVVSSFFVIVSSFRGVSPSIVGASAITACELVVNTYGKWHLNPKAMNRVLLRNVELRAAHQHCDSKSAHCAAHGAKECWTSRIDRAGASQRSSLLGAH